MLHAKEKCCVNSSWEDFHIIDKEKDRYLIRIKEIIFINHFNPSLNRKEDKTVWFYLRNDVMEYCLHSSNFTVSVFSV